MNKLIFVFSFLFIIGCSSKFKPDYIAVLQDHKTITNETNKALIKSIEEEKQTLTNSDDIKVLDDLVMRLSIINRQADVLYKYAVGEAKEETLIQILKKELVQNKDAK